MSLKMGRDYIDEEFEEFGKVGMKKKPFIE